MELTIIGTATGIMIPELDRDRSSSGRLRGLRLLHTHLNDTPLSHEDLMDLLFLRLDSIGVLTISEHGTPLHFQYAHLLPQHTTEDVSRENFQYKQEKENQSPLLLDSKIFQSAKKIKETDDPFAHLSSYKKAFQQSLPDNNTEKGLSKLDIEQILNKELHHIFHDLATLEDSEKNEYNLYEHELSQKKQLAKEKTLQLENNEHKKNSFLDNNSLSEITQKTPYFVSKMFAWDTFQHDFSLEIEALEEEFTRLIRITQNTNLSAYKQSQSKGKLSKIETLQTGSRAVLVSVSRAPKAVQEGNLTELAELARTAGLVIAGSMMQRVTKVHPRQILSQNKLAELEVIALQGHAGIIIFDGELLPAQLQNLAELTERKVLDRTQLILDIFAQHAKTGAGKLQVEMAQLKYTQPRLVNKNHAMDRLMGGIGGRGPGETKLETDRRRIRDRLARIKNDLDTLKKQRFANRARRTKKELPLAALVGYTNAGKSTLLNYLTKSNVLAENKLFATLDPTTRRLRFPKEREMVLADTVGFIRELPKDLVEAFRATLEELDEADLLIHVVDASHPEMDQQLDAVEHILEDLQLQEIPRLLLLNKWDNVDKISQFALRARFPKAFAISALTGDGLNNVTKYMEKILF